jgi:hypothetical protein
MGITEKDLAKKVRCAQSTMHDILNSPEARHSSLVPAINKLLGFPPPADPESVAAPLPSAEALEMAQLYDLLPDRIREQLRDQALTYIDLIKRRTES